MEGEGVVEYISEAEATQHKLAEAGFFSRICPTVQALVRNSPRRLIGICFSGPICVQKQ